MSFPGEKRSRVLPLLVADFPQMNFGSMYFTQGGEWLLNCWQYSQPLELFRHLSRIDGRCGFLKRKPCDLLGVGDIYFPEMTIDHFGAFIQANLVVFVALILLPLKWLVVRVLKDPEAEAVALMSVPEDICYVALGLVMGDMVSGTGAFQKYFSGSPNSSIDKTLTVGANLFVAILVHRLSQWCTTYFRQWRAAEAARATGKDDDPRQGSLRISNAEDNMKRLMVRYLVQFSLGYALQLVIVLMWLHWVAKVVAGA